MVLFCAKKTFGPTSDDPCLNHVAVELVEIISIHLAAVRRPSGGPQLCFQALQLAPHVRGTKQDEAKILPEDVACGDLPGGSERSQVVPEPELQNLGEQTLGELEPEIYAQINYLSSTLDIPDYNKAN